MDAKTLTAAERADSADAVPLIAELEAELQRMYEAHGFQRRAPFPPYREDPLSLCYEKVL